MPEPSEFIPVLPLRGSVLFPHIAMPFAIGRPVSRAAVHAAVASEEKMIAVIMQRDANTSPKTSADLHSTGTRGVVRRMQSGDAGELTVIIQGVDRIVIDELRANEGLSARVRARPMLREEGAGLEALKREVLSLMARAVSLAQGTEVSDLSSLLAADDPVQLLYTLASMLSLEAAEAQELLELDSLFEALRFLHRHLSQEVQVLEIRHEIAKEAAGELKREQREYILRRQLRTIQEQLGESNPEQAELKLLRERLEKAQLPDSVRQEAERELARLERLPAAAAEYHVIRTYFELLLDLPWQTSSEAVLDLRRAKEVLDEDHYGLKDVKERILEHLGVLKLNPRARSPILCFLGPPGVGKTSLGQSIARATGRKFERLSLGGMHDEAELRGHRRTYVGAMPGRILQAIKRAGVNNPVMMLDEVDKLGRDFRGDPAAALLEILDPAQNWSFRDNYLDQAFDLSKVFFITTCNRMETIPGPLLDRMELIRIPGYTHEEKIQIAERYLLPRQVKEAGLAPEQCTFDAAVIPHLISRYTREAGVRQLERMIGSLARKVALKIAQGECERVTLQVADLAELLGPEPFFVDELRDSLPPGVAAGLAWTEAGGQVLYVEAAALPGRPGLTITGQVGDVMQESVRAAETCMWSRASLLGLDPQRIKEVGAHVHVPAGAVPKDGPSAGIAMATALASLYTAHRIRPDTAMTGEITIAGLVLPVGGIKEKLLAARRAGISRIILPEANEKDLREIDEVARAGVQVILVRRIEDAWRAAMPDLELHEGAGPTLQPTH